MHRRSDWVRGWISMQEVEWVRSRTWAVLVTEAVFFQLAIEGGLADAEQVSC
jgi:hypothetical protein